MDLNFFMVLFQYNGQLILIRRRRVFVEIILKVVSTFASNVIILKYFKNI